MIYKLTTMDRQEIVIESEEALQAFLAEANAGKKLVVTKYGIVNVASVASIVRHKEKMEELNEEIRLGKLPEKAAQEVLGPSPFAKLLAPNMKMLSDKI